MEFLTQNWWFLLFLVGYAFIMFRGGGCCGSSSHRGHGHGGHTEAQDNETHKVKSGDKIEMVRDPECGMYVNPDNAVKIEIDGTAFYFCSDTCKNNFMEKRKGKAS